MPRPGPALLVAITTLVAQLALPARAQEAVELELVGRALAGREKPRLVVTVRAPVAALALELDRSDGRSVRQNAGALGPGKTRVFELDQPQGAFHYEGRLLARFPKGPPQDLPLSFDAVLLPPPVLTVKPDAVDLAAHTVTVTLDREATELAVKVSSDEGAVLADVKEAFPGAKAGEPLTVRWLPESPAMVLRVDVRATDKYGFFQDLELYPWRIEIAHEDVLFESGRSDIRPEERPKLDAALSELDKALARYGRFAAVKLYVAGHTDTVNDAAYNQRLSEARALAIARYFRGRTGKVPVLYAGFGESQPLVPTPDETPEPRNRRAAYIVAVEPPPGAHWTRVP
jgi:outer membrane protein OmpA-like peptidoglycan-associated protein